MRHLMWGSAAILIGFALGWGGDLPSHATATAPATAPDATSRPATQPRVYRSMVDLMERMPRHLRADPKKGWDKYQVDEASAWIQKEVVGQKIQFTIALGYVSVYRAPSRPETPWAVMPHFSSDTFQFAGMANTVNVSYPGQYCDAPTAKKWESYKKGKLFTISGTIKHVGSQRMLLGDPKKPALPKGYHYTLTLDNPELKEGGQP